MYNFQTQYNTIQYPFVTAHNLMSVYHNFIKMLLFMLYSNEYCSITVSAQGHFFKFHIISTAALARLVAMKHKITLELEDPI